MEQEVYAVREQNQSRYDKRLILKIVSEVEAGLPRKEANRTYGMGQSTLDSWMRDFGSVNYQQNIRRKNFTSLQKRTIAAAVEQGRMTIQEAQASYKVKNQGTIRTWVSQYKKEKVELCIITGPSMAKKPKPVSAAQTEALQKALEEAQMKINALNTLIDVAEELLKIDIRKKSGARQSSK